MKENIKMIFLFEITRLKDSFEYQTWQKEMKNQLIFINLWHYVEIENVESIDSVVSISIIFEKFCKIKINNFKIVTIMKNRFKCNDKNFLKNEINAKNAWKILKNSFSSFESKMLNDLLIQFWIIILVNNQNVMNYVRRFKMTMQNIRRMIINVSINDNLFILYFHLNFDAKFEQYREHYAQIHEIVSNKSNSIKNINYAINRFLNICVNRSISKKSTLVIIVITFVSNSFFDKVQSNAQLKIKNVVIIIVKMCIICEKKYHTASEHREQLNLKRDRDQFDEERDDRDNKRRRKNDNDGDDERLNSKIDDEEKEHKIYIVINLEILTIMSAMFCQIVYWALNTICFQHNVRDRSTFNFYTTFSKLIIIKFLLVVTSS